MTLFTTLVILPGRELNLSLEEEVDMSEKHQLGDLQMAIMRVIWSKKEATVNQVHQALLQSRGLAPTTIATMLKKMEVKGIVEHRTEGRTFVYSATIEEKDDKRYFNI